MDSVCADTTLSNSQVEASETMMDNNASDAVNNADQPATYDDLFPSLPMGKNPGPTPLPIGDWNKKPMLMSSTVTQVFHIPVSKFGPNSTFFGKIRVFAQFCPEPKFVPSLGRNSVIGSNRNFFFFFSTENAQFFNKFQFFYRLRSVKTKLAILAREARKMRTTLSKG